MDESVTGDGEQSCGLSPLLCRVEWALSGSHDRGQYMGEGEVDDIRDSVRDLWSWVVPKFTG